MSHVAATEKVHTLLTAEDDGRVCRDIPDDACDEQPRNFLVHVTSLASTKTGDGIADPKLTLGWLLATLGAPAYLIGLLVPVREAGALLPQLVTAGWIRSRPVRKTVWAAGSFVQGLCVLGMAAAALALEGAAAGGAIVGLLAVFAIARSFCSVSYKDVLGKTVSKSTRGTATGTAATVASATVLAYGLLLATGLVPVTVPVIAGAVALAGVLWLFAAANFMRLAETPGATDGGGDPLRLAREHLGLLRTDAPLRRFIVVRALLTATAIAPPYILALTAGGLGGVRTDDGGGGGGASAGPGTLGPAVVASALAGVTSTYIWGRLSDRSSRRVLIHAGLGGAAALSAIAAVGWAGLDEAVRAWLVPVLFYGLMVSYQGVRLGRSTHLVDMANEDTRAAYTALSNTAIGLALLGTGAFGALAQTAGTEVVLASFAVMCLLASLLARGMDEVQDDGDDGA